MKKKFLIVALATVIANNVQADLGDLLITEIAVTPFGAEFIEIHNSSDSSINLSDVYLTDATFSENGASTFYYKIVTGNGGGGGFNDFNARFPDGSTIAAGGYQTVSINGSTEFTSAFGVQPTYELYEDAGSADGIPDMRTATPNSIANQSSNNCIPGQEPCPSGLTDSGEVIILYTWDGTSDLVEDLDYIVWGDKIEAVSKTGISIDSLTDADSTPSSYANDTTIGSQIAIANGAHASNNSWQRTDLTEGNEDQSGGNNGFLGADDETSEDTNVTFTEASPTPNIETGGVLPPGAPSIVINEVDAVGTAEFIEIYDGGNGNTNLDGVKVVLFDGNNDQAYSVYDLTGMSTDNSGYFLLGNATTPSPDVILPVDSLQDGADAVAVYFDSGITATDPLSVDNIIDAFVYDSDDDDDAELLALLNVNQLQINENLNGLQNSESSARCANGTGGVLNTSSFQQVSPTPGNINNTCSDEYYASVTPAVVANPALLRSTLHNLIDNHVRFPYSSSSTDACDIIELADEDPSNPNDVWMLYSNESFADINSCAGSYNREHTWPNSRFSGDTDTTQGSDTHNLMTTNKDYNQRRGSLYFDNCLSGCSNASLTTIANNDVGGGSDHGDSNWRNNGVFEVWDYRKGDVARAMFYMDVRYEGDSGEPDLVLTDNTTLLNGGSVNFMGLLSTLCEWHYADPVDVNDITRNEAVFSFQENKNPFVDHPEWVEKVFASTPACINPVDNDVIFKQGFES